MSYAPIEGKLYADAICCTGEWLAQTKSEGSNTILDEYLKKAVIIFCSSLLFLIHSFNKVELYDEYGGNVCRAYFTLARYADSLYTSLEDKIRSTEWAASQELRVYKERELKQCEELLKKKKNDKELQRHIILLKRQCEIDKQENERQEEGFTLSLSLSLSLSHTHTHTPNNLKLITENPPARARRKKRKRKPNLLSFKVLLLPLSR